MEGLELGFWDLRTVEEWAVEDAALERAGALPKDIGKKARIASSSMSPPSAMGALVDGKEGSGGWSAGGGGISVRFGSGASAGSGPEGCGSRVLAAPCRSGVGARARDRDNRFRFQLSINQIVGAQSLPSNKRAVGEAAAEAEAEAESGVGGEWS
jgi:hypothetical protein